MNTRLLDRSVIAIAIIFTLFSAIKIIPPLIENPDIVGAFAAGFVNPYSSGYSFDVICCWLILALWVWQEAREYEVRHGIWCLLLGLVPGVAVGFALYLVLRNRHFHRLHAASEAA